MRSGAIDQNEEKYQRKKKRTLVDPQPLHVVLAKASNRIVVVRSLFGHVHGFRHGLRQTQGFHRLSFGRRATRAYQPVEREEDRWTPG